MISISDKIGVIFDRMFLFDLSFYLITRFYAGFKEKSPASTAATIVGGLQTMNIFTGIMLAAVVLEKKRIFQEVFILLGTFFVLEVISYTRYIHKGEKLIARIEETWLQKSDVQKTRWRLSVAIYISASVISFIGLAIYLGSQAN